MSIQSAWTNQITEVFIAPTTWVKGHLKQASISIKTGSLDQNRARKATIWEYEHPLA